MFSIFFFFSLFRFVFFFILCAFFVSMCFLFCSWQFNCCYSKFKLHRKVKASVIKSSKQAEIEQATEQQQTQQQQEQQEQQASSTSSSSSASSSSQSSSSSSTPPSANAQLSSTINLSREMPLPSISILKPLMGIDPNLQQNLETFFTMNYQTVRTLNIIQFNEKKTKTMKNTVKSLCPIS